MTYADSTTITKRLITLTLNPDVLSESIDSIDTIIISELTKYDLIPPTSDDTLTNAANYFVCSDMLDSMVDTSENRSPTAIAYEKKGMLLLEGYIETSKESGVSSPYTRSNTDTSWYDHRRRSGYYDLTGRGNRRGL